MKKNGFGDRLKTLLKQKKLTQAQLATAIGTSEPSVSRWTKGGEIEYANLRALADYLEVNWIWLRYGDVAIASLRENMPDNNPAADMRREYLDEIMINEAKMKSALEMAEIVNWEWNVLTGTITCSQNANNVFGVEPASLPSCMLPFSDAPINELIQTFGQAQPHSWDFSVTGNDGMERWFTSRARLIFDTANRPMKVVGVSSDITDRKSVEQALEQSEYMMRRIVDLVPVGLWAADAEGNICLANPEVKRIWGGAKYVGLSQYGQYKGWWEQTGEEVGAEGWTLARAVKNGETSKPEIVNIEAFDGKHRTIRMHSTPLFNEQHKIIGAIEVNQDITDLKRVERSLKANLEEWEVIFKQELFAVFQVCDGVISRINNATVKALGLKSPADIELTDIFTPKSSEDIEQALSLNSSESQIILGQLKNNDEPMDIYLLPQRQEQERNKFLIMFALKH